MKAPSEITREDLDEMARLKKQAADGYTKADLASITNLVRTYVNNRASDCASCGNNLAKNKNDLNEFYLMHRDAAEIRLKAEEEKAERRNFFTAIDKVKAKNEVKNYVDSSTKNTENGKEEEGK